MDKMKKNSLFTTGLGLWASGMLIGASVVDLFPLGPPSWHPVLLLAIGILIGITGLAQLYKLGNSSNAQ